MSHRLAPVPRLLAAAALAVYAFVNGLLLPLHLLEESAPSGPVGTVLTADCGDRNCHAPGHDHGNRGHHHDAAHCLLCGATAAPRTAPPAAADQVPATVPVAPAPAFAAPRFSSVRRGIPSARAPPGPLVSA